MPFLLTQKSKPTVPAVIVGVALLILFAPRAASACTCDPLKDAHEAFDHAEVVFVGTVISVTKPKPRIVDRRRNLIEVSLELVVRFKVERAWKFATHRYLTLTTMAQTAACGYPFKVGEKYLVFAASDQDGVRTGLCSGTTDFAHAQTYLEQIGPGKPIPINRTILRAGRPPFWQRHNKSLDASGGSVFLNLIRPAMVD
jgi:hypothetical protein